MRRASILLVALAGLCLKAAAQAPAAPNSDPTYLQLRNLTLGSEAVSLTGYDLRRDAATFHLKSGTVCFVPPVNGKVTGAVFVGEGSMSLDPPTRDEQRSLKLLTKSDEFNETFQHLVLRFTDSTYDDLKKAGTPSQASCDSGLLKDSQNATRHKLHRNLEARILEDLLRSDPGGLFVAFIHGQHYDDKLLYIIDPNGAPNVSPEQVELTTYGITNPGIWTAFSFSRDYAATLGAAAAPVSRTNIQSQNLDVTVEGNAYLSGKAETKFALLGQPSRAIPFNLFRSLRVRSVVGPDGQPLSFIQEDKDDDPDFYIITSKPLAQGQTYAITTEYGGKDAVTNEGNGNYYPVARVDWYPNDADAPFAQQCAFDMIFRIPKGMRMAASGNLVSDKEVGNQDVSEWKSDAPQSIAGFQFGRMKVEQASLTSPAYLVATYANEEPPDWAYNAVGANGSRVSTVAVMKEPLSEAQFAIRLYSDYFGPLPFKRLSLTQQTACDYGQSWPELVWLPICSFYAREGPLGERTLRGTFVVDASRASRGYWVVVTPHEVAHQWWGDYVEFDSYRDRWLGEGLADFSASLFLESAYEDKARWLYPKFWDDERRSIVERNNYGFRAIDVGPVTMGYRLNNGKAGFDVDRELIYAKGAYIFQMLRQMMWSPQSQDENFKNMMRDFVKTYGERTATTADLQSMVEKHMTPDMNVGGNGKMDWFFDEYVYGTALPAYQFNAGFSKGPSGEVVMTYTLAQSGVDSNFAMLIPIYLELADGRTVFLGRVVRRGNATGQGKITLKGVTTPPKRALINYNYDVLAAN
ncbi:MAG TPA: M1 family aminopeptidase [Candidatus Limnocylindrales bacterium]|nr:M1 family aminopeptidase [Candidatus Limnocylindrales bacterium]